MFFFIKTCRHLPLLSSVLFCSCMLGPKDPPSYKEVSYAFEEQDSALTESQGDLSTFWQQFNDSILLKLIKTCTERNFDVRLAEEKVKELRASYHMESADLWPSVNASASALRFKKPSALFGVPLPPPSVQNLYVLGFDASWEIDFFGKVRSAKKAAYYDVLSQEENVHSMQVRVVAEVARLYTDIRTSQQRIDVTKKKIETQKSLLSLSLSLINAGLSSDIDVENERASLAASESLLPSLVKQMKDSLYQLTFLIGAYPQEMQELIQKRRPIPFAQNKVPIGLPSDLLKRRPDILSAERSYYSASARIGSAKAELFPSISLTGAWALANSEASDLFTKASQLWLIWPTINWNIFQGWKTLANIKVQSSKQKQALISYERAIALSLSDVETSLSAYAEDNLSMQSYKKQLTAKNKAHTLSASLTLIGLQEKRQALLAEKEFYDAKDLYLQGKKSLMTSLISLYKALGGGWDIAPSS